MATPQGLDGRGGRGSMQVQSVVGPGEQNNLRKACFCGRSARAVYMAREIKQ